MLKLGIKDDIIKWLKEEDLDISEIPIPKEAPIEWAINAMSKIPMKVSISVQKPKGRTEKYACTMGVKVADEHKEKLSHLSEQDKANMIGELLRSLYYMCSSCIIIFQPDLSMPDNIIVTKVIYGEKLSQSELTDSIRLLTNTYTLIATYFNIKLGGSFKQGGQTVMHM